MRYRYILDGRMPVEEADLMKWAKWFERADRKVALTALGGGVEVSTVFLGLNHNWGDGPPLLFETMVFGGEHDSYQQYHSTWEEAEEGHKQVVEMVKGGSGAISNG